MTTLSFSLEGRDGERQRERERETQINSQLESLAESGRLKNILRHDDLSIVSRNMRNPLQQAFSRATLQDV